MSITSHAAPAAKSICVSAECTRALGLLNQALTAEVSAAGRTGAQILLRQPNDGRYVGSRVNAQIGEIHSRASNGNWYLVHAKRSDKGAITVKGVYALKAKPGKAAAATENVMALQLGNPARPDMLPLASAVNALVKNLPRAPQPLAEGQLPKWLGGSSLVAVVGYDVDAKTLSHFAVVPDVIDVRLAGKAKANSRSEELTPNTSGDAPALAAVMASPPTSASGNASGTVAGVANAQSSAGVTAAKPGKPEKLKKQLISTRPGESIYLLSDTQGNPRSLQFDVDPDLLEQTQRSEAAGRK